MRCTAIISLVLLISAPTTAIADPTPVVQPPTHLASSSAVHTDGGSDLRLPAGYFLPEPTWSVLVTETKRLQDAETRLKAENASLRTSVANSSPSWYVLATAVVSSLAAGWYLHSKI